MEKTPLLPKAVAGLVIENKILFPDPEIKSDKQGAHQHHVRYREFVLYSLPTLHLNTLHSTRWKPTHGFQNQKGLQWWKRDMKRCSGLRSCFSLHCVDELMWYFSSVSDEGYICKAIDNKLVHVTVLLLFRDFLCTLHFKWPSDKR